MIEAYQIAYLAIGLLGLIGFVLLYAAGGGSHRELYRRILAPLALSAACSLSAALSGHLKWVMFASWPLYFVTLSLGYSADTTPSKMRRRALYGALNGLVSGVWLLPFGSWQIWLFQTVLAAAASVFYGVLNPQSRVGEEGAISLFLVATVPFRVI